jgi:hypothetical protein
MGLEMSILGTIAFGLLVAWIVWHLIPTSWQGE